MPVIPTSARQQLPATVLRYAVQVRRVLVLVLVLTVVLLVLVRTGTASTVLRQNLYCTNTTSNRLFVRRTSVLVLRTRTEYRYVLVLYSVLGYPDTVQVQVLEYVVHYKYSSYCMVDVLGSGIHSFVTERSTDRSTEQKYKKVLQ